jgi:hypothetical protein
MNNDIRQSLARLEQIPPAELNATDGELTVLLTALRKEVESQTGVLNNADPAHATYTVAADDLTALLQLTNTVIHTKAELAKLVTAAEKTMQRVWKRVPK